MGLRAVNEPSPGRTFSAASIINRRRGFFNLEQHALEVRAELLRLIASAVGLLGNKRFVVIFIEGFYILVMKETSHERYRVTILICLEKFD